MTTPVATVLVVDDDSLVRAAARATLERFNLVVREAADGEAALRSLAAKPVDAVLIDILMPHKEGLETILEIKRSYPDVKVYAMSASGRRNGHDFLKVAEKFGAHAVLQKPFTPAQLLALFGAETAPQDTGRASGA